MKIWLIAILILCAVNLRGQSFEITMDTESKNRIAGFNASQAAITSVKVYRIQFDVVSDRREMETTLRSFKTLYNLDPDWHQTGPYFYMKAGYYPTKLASYKDFIEIRKKYSSAIYIVESVDKSKLVSQ